MKKNTLLLVIGLLVTSMIFSQNEKRIGINAGTTFSSFRGNPTVEDYDMKFAFLVGISFEYSFKENLSLKTNLNFERKSISSQGVFIDNLGLANGIKGDINFDYLTLPILVKYEFGNSNNFFTNGGPFLGYLLSTKHKFSGYPEYDSTSLNKKVDIGLSFGIGTKFNLRNKNILNLELRDNIGLINISDVPVQDNGTLKSNSINLILSWEFEI